MVCASSINLSPTDWEWVPFEKAFNDQTRLSKKVKKNNYAKDGDFAVIDQGKKEIAGYTNDESLLFSGELPVLIFGDHTRVIKYIDRPFACGADGTRVLKSADSLDPEFSYFYLRSVQLENLGYSRHYKLLKEIQVPVPPIEQQRRIVDILRRADSIRCLRKQAQEIARQLIPALFIEMFGDPATNSKKWPMGAIGDVLTKAQYGTSKKAHEEATGLPVIRMGNVLTSGALDLKSLKYMELDENEQKKYELEVGDILFNRTNSKELVGKTGMWKGDFDAVAASYFIVARTDRNKVLPTYLWAFMNTLYMKRRLYDTARGAIGQSNINAKELKAFSIPLPPIELQEFFDIRLENIHSILGQQEEAFKSAESCFQSLLHQAFKNSS